MTPSPITTKEIAIDEIVIDLTIQVRAKMDEATVERYAEAMKDGDKFPNIVVYAAKKDAETYLLSDGAHRLEAAKRIGLQTLRVEVHMGGRSDALRYALSANYSHGLHRSNEDKRHSVNLALTEWPQLSSAQLAKICAVSDMLVNSIRDAKRNAFIEGQGINLKTLEVETRIGADGKSRKVPAKPAVKESLTTEPPPTPKLDNEFAQALGFQSASDLKESPPREPSVIEYYERLERFAGDAFENATDKQLTSMAVYAATIPKRVREIINQRKTRKAA